MKTKDENLFILYLHITLLYSINLDTMDLLVAINTKEYVYKHQTAEF